MHRERPKKNQAVYGSGTSFVLGEISYFAEMRIFNCIVRNNLFISDSIVASFASELYFGKNVSFILWYRV